MFWRCHSAMTSTYINSYSGELKHFHWRLLVRCIAIELPSSLVPFDRVEGIVFQIEKTFQRHILTTSHCVWQFHAHISQRQASYNNHNHNHNDIHTFNYTHTMNKLQLNIIWAKDIPKDKSGQKADFELSNIPKILARINMETNDLFVSGRATRANTYNTNYIQSWGSRKQTTITQLQKWH